MKTSGDLTSPSHGSPNPFQNGDVAWRRVSDSAPGIGRSQVQILSHIICKSILCLVGLIDPPLEDWTRCCQASWLIVD